VTVYSLTGSFGAFVATGSSGASKLRRSLVGAGARVTISGGSARITTPALPRSLLPPNNPTKLDVAQEMTDAARYPLDWDAVLRAKDPMRVDAPLLPLLAWERSTDLWRADWPLAKKRHVTDIAFEMQRKKGTRAGIEQYVEVAGGQCLSIAAPPLMCFPGADPTPEETAAWLARFAQLRTYKYSEYGNDAFAIFLTEETMRPLCLTDGTPRYWCLHEIDATQYLGSHTTLWQNGVETPLSALAATTGQAQGSVADYRIIVLPADLAGVWFLDSSPSVSVDGEIAYTPSSYDPVAARTISFVTDGNDYGANSGIFTSVTVSPGLDLVTIKPTMVAQPAPTKSGDWYLDARAAVLSDGELALFPTSDDRAEYNLYEVLYLYDPSNPGPISMAPGSYCYLDNAFFQFPAYTAIVRVAVTGTLPAAAFTNYVGGYLVDPDLTPLWDVVGAVRSAKSARDLVLVDSNVYGVVTAGVGVFAGAITAGQMVQN